MRYLLVCLFFTCLLQVFFVLPIFAFDDEYFDKFSRQPVKDNQAVSLPYFLDLMEINNQEVTTLEKKRLFLLLKTIEKISDANSVSYESLVFIAKIVKYIRNYPVFTQKRSVFIYPLKYKNKNYSLQIYHTGTALIHLKKNDKNYTKGGYKSFSRSIDFDTHNIYATLTFPLTSDSSFDKARNELMIMDTLKSNNDKHNLFYFDYDISHGKRDGKIINKLIFYTKLYQEDLRDYLKDNKLSFPNILKLSEKMMLALQELHSHHFIHNDIKSQNFLVADNLQKVVLTDFGLSVEEKNKKFGDGISGTRGYIDPSYCISRIERGYSYKSFSEATSGDTFSLGMVLYKKFFKSLHLADKIKEINYLAMPKKELERGSVEDIKLKIKEYKESHYLYLKMLKNKDKNVKREFYQLVLMMIHPQKSMRPSLNKCLKKIQKMKP